MATLPDTDLLVIKSVSEAENEGTFVIEPLSPGYGTTTGNALRRILLSSLEGAAVSSARIEGVTHEFSTIRGVEEDVIRIILNLKSLRLKLHTQEPANLTLEQKGPGVVTAGDFKPNPAVEFVDPKQPIATLDKDGKLVMEIEVMRGRGYLSSEARRETKLPLGTIVLDCAFSSIVRVNYEIENMRVGSSTNYDRLIMTIKTDGSVTPLEALQTAAKIAVEHFSIIGGINEAVPPPDKEATPVSIATDDSLGEAIPTQAKTPTKEAKTADRKGVGTKAETSPGSKTRRPKSEVTSPKKAAPKTKAPPQGKMPVKNKP